MPKPLLKLKRLLSTGLEQTASLWAPITIAYDWVHQAATVLKNAACLDAVDLQHSYSHLLTAMPSCKTQVGELAAGIDYFLKVTRSYWSGLFHCYDINGLPRTNNDLEQLFGSWRHHQRRCNGRKIATASSVLRGSVQLVAAVTTRLTVFTARDLAMVSVTAWQKLRSQLEQHRLKRVKQRRFRRSPTTYLSELETQLLQLVLPL